MTTIMRPDDVRKQNRRRILAAVRREGLASRTDIGRATGLSAATISAITSSLIAEGVLIPPARIDPLRAGRGRPKVSLGINPDAALVGTVEFQLNSVSAAVIDYAGTTVAEHTLKIATSVAGPEDIRKALLSALGEAMKHKTAGAGRLRRIAVGVQGVTDIDRTAMLWSPISRHRNLPIKVWLEDGFGVPARVSNDCDMIARALNWRDPGRYGATFAAVLLSHGVGMGLFLRGKLINGTRSSGTEFGHMTYIPGGASCRCGARGCIEAYAGDYAIGRRAKGEAAGGEAAGGGAEDVPPPDLTQNPDIQAIVDAALGGDLQARAAIEAAGAAIGTGLSSIYALVDPFPIVLVGSGSKAFGLMERPIRQALNGTIAGNAAHDISIDCFADERPLVREGCAISALLMHDDQIAEHRSFSEVAI
ncbi:hypothetical protein MNBD_ALPHA09-1993 [hydrothermal vent metagenome]|uniref:Xylose-responsive transcription regulator, ROK family n=1 Tax=hydrothermal vent metagenome TaxID=652676 RepID=A0A3B0U5B8_9ZZZZ